MICRLPARLRPLCGGLVIGLLALSSAAAEETPLLKLMRPDSLAGWDHGLPPPAGWTIAEGRLSGHGDSIPLLSGFSFGQFTLQFQWSTQGGAWRVLLPEVPRGEGLSLTLREGEHCGQVRDGANVVAEGGRIDPVGDRMHTTVLERSTDKLAVTVDGRQVAEVALAGARRFGLGLALQGGDGSLAGLVAREPQGVPMFNGKDLAGWWCPGDIKAWAIQNGELVLAGHGGNYLRSDKNYANFTLSADYCIQRGGNSGIGIRTPRNGWPSGDGMELQIHDSRPTAALVPGENMGIYGNVPPLTFAHRSEEYNHVVIKADGRMISAWINGELVQQANTAREPELKYRHLSGWIGFQDHGNHVQYRNVCVLEASEGLGLDAWYADRPLSIASSMIDRLMNPEQLSCPDRFRSVARTAHAEAKKGDQVLAELTGPGVLLRVAGTTPEGKLAFYLDGESKPRLEARLPDLGGKFLFDSDPGQAITFLPFAKSLKVVRRGAKQAGDYRLEYVTAPADMPVESFRDRTSVCERGWLDALYYRRHQAEWGAHRENDPAPRYQGEVKRLEPGQRSELVRVDGAGIVQWIKLKANKNVLDRGDLWLEATIDGESSPAVAAPARFWFPGFGPQEGNFANFVMLERGGLFFRLAMPFGRGIAYALRNAGSKRIDGLGLEVSVLPADESQRAEVAKRMRLRGTFLPAGSNPELVRCEGAGRWVGLVYQEPEGKPTAIESLRVDGEFVDGWRMSSLDLWLGRVGDFRGSLSGRRGPLCWQYQLLAPVEFGKTLLLQSAGPSVGDRFALYYLTPQMPLKGGSDVSKND